MAHMAQPEEIREDPGAEEDLAVVWLYQLHRRTQGLCRRGASHRPTPWMWCAPCPTGRF